MVEGNFAMDTHAIHSWVGLEVGGADIEILPQKPE